jgi:hypothetical protein
MRVLDCYIDDDGAFQVNKEAMVTWFNQAVLDLEVMKPPQEDLPFYIFLMGCEAALRCQEIDKIH